MRTPKELHARLKVSRCKAYDSKVLDKACVDYPLFSDDEGETIFDRPDDVPRPVPSKGILKHKTRSPGVRQPVPDASPGDRQDVAQPRRDGYDRDS